MSDNRRRTAEDAHSASRVLGQLHGQIVSLPRDEFGDHNTLAVEAAYRRVEQLVVEAIERAHTQNTPI